jgi:hypothetical protein
MRHEFKDLYAEFGPLLVFDASSQPRWAGYTFDRFVLDDVLAEEAAAGWCTHVTSSGLRQFSGTVELLLEESAPAHTQYAVQHASALWLRVPSGKLVLSTPAQLVSNGAEYSDGLRHELDVPAGDYAVDAWSYVDHELRLESQPDPLPGEPPRSAWSTVVVVLQLGMALVSLCAIFFAVAAYQTSSWDLIGLDALAVAGGWVVIEVIRRLSGEAERSRKRSEAFNAVLAALPPVPNFTLVLRKVDVPPARGGGISDTFGDPPV